MFTKKYPKKENNKYPLRINYTNDNINNALESESILEFNEDKETDKDFSSKRDSKKFQILIFIIIIHIIIMKIIIITIKIGNIIIIIMRI